MSYNGSGVYSLPGAQLVNGEIVSATENNTSRNDFAAAFNVAWTRDGQSPATGNIPMGNHKFTGMLAGTTNGDSVRYEQTTLKTGATGSSALPAGTTAQRDGSPASGYTRFNTDTGSEEYYNGTAWVTVSDSATAVTLTGAQTLTNKTLTSPVINGTGVNFSDGSIQNTAATGFGFKNRIINGAMVIDQRNAGASVTPTDNAYMVDRWCLPSSQASKFTAQQNAGSVTPPAGFSNYLGLTSTSSYSVLSGDYFALVQRIEGLNTADLGWGAAGASTVTLSFWVRSSLTGTFGGAIVNNGFDYSYPFTYTISSAGTWEQKTITIAGPTSGTWLKTNATGISIQFGLGVGSTYSGTAGAWTGSGKFSATGATSVVGTNGATFYITGVQLEKGSTATSFDYRPYGTELQLCQRYYYSLVKGDQQELSNSFFYSSSEYNCVVSTPVTMRATPSLSQSTGSSYYSVNKSGTALTFNGWNGIARGNSNNVLLYLVGISGYTAGYAASTYTTNASASIALSAEL